VSGRVAARIVVTRRIAEPALELLAPAGEVWVSPHDRPLATDELHAAGLSREGADEQSRTQSAQLIPDGVNSVGQEFFTAWVGEERVGHLWLSTERPMAFVYDIVVLEEQRRKGYGAAVMNAGAVWSREHGHFALGLNVFAHNPGARALYDRLGYVVTVDYRTLDVPDAG